MDAPTEDLRKMREDFLRQFSVVELDERVARDIIGLRQGRRLKLGYEPPSSSPRCQHCCYPPAHDTRRTTDDVFPLLQPDIIHTRRSTPSPRYIDPRGGLLVGGLLEVSSPLQN